MIVHALIEVWPGETAVYIHEMPGLFVSGNDLDAALALLPDQVEHHLAWLNTHGAGLESDDIEIALVEQLRSPDDATGPLFAADQQPPAPRDIERGIAVAWLAARDLIDVYRSVSEHRRQQRIDAGGWTMGDHLRHVARMNHDYIAAFDPAPPSLSGDPVRDVLTSTSHATSVLQTFAPGDWGTIRERQGELWTPAKSLRRMAAHLREHHPWLRELASA